MIFATVGTQLPFDRMIAALDRWAGDNKRSDIVAQVGSTSLQLKNITWKRTMTPEEFRARIQEASIVVSHAGIGSIITALEFRKPTLVMPRLAALHEHRSDHQVATAEQLSNLGYVNVAQDEDELLRLLDQLEELPIYEIRPWASDQLIDSIRGFIEK